MTSSSRRRLMKALAAGGGAVAIADHWAKPVVDTVMLPAHAAITGCRSYSGSTDFPTGDTCFDPPTCLNIQICGNDVQIEFFEEEDVWTGAGSLEGDRSFDIEIIQGGTSVDTFVSGQLNEASDEISGTIGGGNCGLQPNPYTIDLGAPCVKNLGP